MSCPGSPSKRVRILLDECLPHELADELVGHEVRSVQQEGWSGTENGELLLLASGGFGVFLTVDKQIQHTQSLPPNLARVTIKARSNRIQALRPRVPDLLKALESVRPGTFIRVGA